MRFDYIGIDGTNRSLKRLYRAFNKVYFGSQLDPAMTVRFSSKVMRNNGILNPAEEEIVISREYRHNFRMAAWILLHEMNHMVTRYHGHGRKSFDKGMLRLAKAGAFHKIW